MDKVLIDIVAGAALGTYIYLECITKRTGLDFIRTFRGFITLLFVELGGFWIAETIRTKILGW